MAEPPPTGPLAEHFRILHNFGRSKLVQEKHDDLTFREEMWRMSCASARLPYVPHADVVAAWKQFIVGHHGDSSLALSGDVDPHFISLGVAFQHKLVAAHTLRTRTLLRQVLSIYARAFPEGNDFLAEVQGLCQEVLTSNEPKRKRP